MEKFKPVYMKCTQEMFDIMRPKLESVGCVISLITSFNGCDYLVNNHDGIEKIVTNLNRGQMCDVKYNRNEVHTEAEFLSACGYVEEETLQEKEQRLIKELKEVQNAIKENEPKVGELVIAMSIETNKKAIYKLEECHINRDFFKIIKLPKDLQEQLKPYFNV